MHDTREVELPRLQRCLLIRHLCWHRITSSTPDTFSVEFVMQNRWYSSETVGRAVGRAVYCYVATSYCDK